MDAPLLPHGSPTAVETLRTPPPTISFRYPHTLLPAAPPPSRSKEELRRPTASSREHLSSECCRELEEATERGVASQEGGGVEASADGASAGGREGLPEEGEDGGDRGEGEGAQGGADRGTRKDRCRVQGAALVLRGTRMLRSRNLRSSGRRSMPG
ncbi:hypothetical protein HPP92_006358 [Vanilla planifolia]|uniref:Uncharacterized protein n=1 Tax=Vanilla planifolia TaxID=51239 RepID=A0A835RJR7_VANPL|nr:hypothetical protein HPP92_006358 [Vanilla planifolia]